MSTSNYSFGDVFLTVSHPSVGQYVANGQGLGNISTTMATERTAHEVSADGSVMISKIKGRNGSHAISVQQTSEFHKWLLKLFNYLETASTSEWASISIVIRSVAMQDLIMSSGVSFQKIPDRPFQAQGQQITWNLMAAEIQQYVV